MECNQLSAVMMGIAFSAALKSDFLNMKDVVCSTDSFAVIQGSDEASVYSNDQRPYYVPRHGQHDTIPETELYIGSENNQVHL